jgi:hypothetical protein
LSDGHDSGNGTRLRLARQAHGFKTADPGRPALDEPVIDAHLPIRSYPPGNQMATDGRSFTWCLVRLRWTRRVPILATALIGIATSLRPHPCPSWRSTWVT